MKTILLKLAGPLQSWGTGSHFEKRHTDHYPSKSAVLGLVAASLGYRRDEDEKIQKLNELHFAVRIDQPGHILRDYHTAHKYKANGDLDRTYVTERYYLEDAVFAAAIGSEDDSWMTTIEDALRNPYFQPFLGRKSLPLTADFILGITNKDVIPSLLELEWQAASWYQKRNPAILEIYVDADAKDTRQTFYRKDRILSFSDHERKYEYRKEKRMTVKLEGAERDPDEQHDAFGAVGE